MAKILIVDDDATITQLMQALVTMAGHEPTVVNDSMQVIETAKSLTPDMITLDLMMPGLTGFELCRILRGEPSFSSVPILIVSAKDDTESKQKALGLGATEYIVKPFGVDEFIEAIKTHTSVPH
jgi:DNA-binding response OmpR family regulator